VFWTYIIKIGSVPGNSLFNEGYIEYSAGKREFLIAGVSCWKRFFSETLEICKTFGYLITGFSIDFFS
jgi:hypothetical protein